MICRQPPAAFFPHSCTRPRGTWTPPLGAGSAPQPEEGAPPFQLRTEASDLEVPMLTKLWYRSYRQHTAHIRGPNTPYCQRTPHRTSRGTRSNAFSKSSKYMLGKLPCTLKDSADDATLRPQHWLAASTTNSFLSSGWNCWSSPEGGFWHSFWQETLTGIPCKPSQYICICRVWQASSPTIRANSPTFIWVCRTCSRKSEGTRPQSRSLSAHMDTFIP